MVPAHSRKIPRVSRYSGYCRFPSFFTYRAFTFSDRSFQFRLVKIQNSLYSPNPSMHAYWFRLFPFRSPLLRESIFSFSSSGYLDVSVRRVPLHALWIGAWMHGVLPCGFPHSDTCGSPGICPSPQLFAACRVFHRLLVPRHPPCALSCLTSFEASSPLLPEAYSVMPGSRMVSHAPLVCLGFLMS